MRDPNRMVVILDLLGQIWMYCPDLRLGQVMVNVVQDGETYEQDVSRMFYIEDDKMIEKLKSFHALCQQQNQPRT